jgi:hypothetical protein
MPTHTPTAQGCTMAPPKPKLSAPSNGTTTGDRADGCSFRKTGCTANREST